MRRLARSLWDGARAPVLAASMLAWCASAPAATITLKDGTVIQGEVKSLQDGVYTIDTTSVGTVHVSEKQVRSIADGGAAPSPSSGLGSLFGGGTSGTSALQAAKSLVEQDPKLLGAVLELQSDPDMIAVLSDPDIMKAVAAGDYNGLMSNPKIIALMQNPKVRALVDAAR